MPSTQADVIDGVSTSLAIKAPVRAALSGNDTLSGLAARATVNDGSVVPLDGERWLVPNQTNPTRNGIYIARAGLWVRSADFDGARDATKGTRVFTYSGYLWALTADNPVTIGASALTFVSASVVPASQGSYLIDIRDFGASELKTVNENSDAFLAMVNAAQTSGGAITTCRVVGTFTFDATRFNYEAANFNRAINHIDNPHCTLILGGTINFVNSATGSHAANTFYHPNYWRIRGEAGIGNPQQQTVATQTIVNGNWECRGYNSQLEDILGNGTLTLQGPTTGLDAGVELVRVNFQQITNNSVPPPALIIDGKYSMRFDHCSFTSLDGAHPANPTISILVKNTNQQTGLARFTKTYVAGGNITFQVTDSVFNHTVDWVFDEMLHESLNQPYLFDFIGAPAPQTLLGKFYFGRVEVADNLVPYQFIRVQDCTMHGAKFDQIGSGAVATEATLKNIRLMEWDDAGTFFEGSTVEYNLANWASGQRLRSINACTDNPTSTGYGIAPGYVKPNYNVLYNAPNGSWATVGGGGFDAVSNGYTLAVTTSDQPALRALSGVGALAAGDVIVVGCWAKRLEQTHRTQFIQLQGSIGGVNQTDGFTGLTTVRGEAAMARFGGYAWYYIYSCFQVVTPGAYGALAFFTPPEVNGTQTISDVTYAVMKGLPTRHEVEQMAMANVRYPSLLNASYAITKYYSYAPAYHAVNADTAFGSPKSKQMALLPDNTFATGKAATGARPTQVGGGNLPEGSQFFDITLHKPIWADGAGGWKDSAGTGV